MSIPPLPAEGATDWTPWAQGIDEAARTALTADAAVAAVEAEAAVAPTGAWDFTQAPTVGGQPIGNGNVTGTEIANLVKITQLAYDALGTKDGSTLYVIQG